MDDTTAPTGVAAASADASDNAASAKKRPRTDDDTTFVLPDGSRHVLTALAAQAYPDGLLCRMSTSELTVRNDDGSISIAYECADPAAFALAVAEHEFTARHINADFYQRCGPPLSVPINPQALHALWDYLGLPTQRLEPNIIRRVGTPSNVLITQTALHRSLALAQHLNTFLNALHFELTESLVSMPIILPPDRHVPTALIFIKHDECHSILDAARRFDPEKVDENAWFPIEVLQLLSDRPRLMTLAELYLPKRMEELESISFRRCTSSDRDQFRLTRLTLHARLSPSYQDMYMRTTHLLGSMALAIDCWGILTPNLVNIQESFTVDSWIVTIHVVGDEVASEDMVDVPADPALALPDSEYYMYSGRSKYAPNRDLRIFASVKPTGSAVYKSELHPLGICVHTSFADGDDTEMADAKWLRKTFFEKEAAEQETHYDQSLSSRVLTREEYEPLLEQEAGAGNDEAAQPYAPGMRKDADQLHAVPCCMNAMLAPIGVGEFSAPDMDEMRAAVKADPKHSILGDDSCASYVTLHVEVHSLLPQFAEQRLGCGGPGAFQDVEKYGVIEITGC